MSDRTEFDQVDWSLNDDHAEERKQRLDDVWKHIRPLDDKPFDNPKGPTSNSTIDELAKMGVTFGSFDDDTHTAPAREMEKVSIGPIPESEEQSAKAWYNLFESLKTVECRLDPRLNHKDGTPYDPIDLTFRIVDAIKTLEGIRSKIADRFCFTEPHIHDYSFSASDQFSRKETSHMNTTENPSDSLPKVPEVASSVHPLGNPPSADTDSTSDPFHGQSFSAGLPPYFHVRPHSPDGDLKKGCTVKYSLKRHDLFNGDKIANEWADQYGLENIGSGCRMVGDPIRDIQFEPLRLLPLELDPKRILPHLYKLEIDGHYVIVRFQTMRIPNGDIQAVFSFLTKWAESNNLVFASSCHERPRPSTPIKECYSFIMFRPKGDIGGKIELLVTPGHDDPNCINAEAEDAQVPPPPPSATPSTPSDDAPFPTEDFVPADSPFS